MADKPLQSLNFPGHNYTYVNTPLSTAPTFDNTTVYAVGGGSSKFRFYAFKMWSQGKLIRDYRPCVRKSDNKAGFYDMVNHTFNPSIGTADFIAGND